MMRTVENAKAIAKRLKVKLFEQNIVISHGNALELAADILGSPDWNTFHAQHKDAFDPASAELCAVNKKTNQPEDMVSPRESDWVDVAAPIYDRHFTAFDRTVPARHRRAKWQLLFDEANTLYERGEKPDSEKVVELARRWLDCSWETSGDNIEYKKKSAAAYRDALKDPAVSPKLPLSEEVLTFVEFALKQAWSERQSR